MEKGFVESLLKAMRDERDVMDKLIQRLESAEGDSANEDHKCCDCCGAGSLDVQYQNACLQAVKQKLLSQVFYDVIYGIVPLTPEDAAPMLYDLVGDKLAYMLMEGAISYDDAIKICMDIGLLIEESHTVPIDEALAFLNNETADDDDEEDSEEE